MYFTNWATNPAQIWLPIVVHIHPSEGLSGKGRRGIAQEAAGPGRQLAVGTCAQKHIGRE